MNASMKMFLAVAVALAASTSARAGETTKNLDSTPQVKVYRASLAAMKAGDYDAYKKCMVKQAGAEMDKQAKEMGKTPKEILGFLTMMTPDDMKFTSLKVEGKSATLTATGTVGGEANKGTIELAEEDGAWKVGHQSWSNAK